jgi:ubiquinone/menaquinone biosynthesis C-methylase UbiE
MHPGGVLIAAALLAMAAFAYWLFVITEGAYLGRRLVIWLYDRGAKSYDAVKEYDSVEEAWFLGIPMARELEGIAHPLVLDVATGTGRMALALIHQLTFDGHVVGLDASREMLRIAAQRTRPYAQRVTLVWKNATCLPFDDNSFDAVACIEALEFLPQPKQTLREMVRVLRPGGAFVVTNRIGWETYLMPGRAFRRQQFEALLADLGLVEIVTKPWQELYDLVWARKRPADRAAELRDRGASETVARYVRIRCCRCDGGYLEAKGERFVCTTCDAEYQVVEGIIELEGRKRWFGLG